MTQYLVMTGNQMPPRQYCAGRGSTLLLLHGLGGTWEIWKPVLAALQERHQVIAVTLPGHHGGSAFVGIGDATVAGIADQIIDELRRQGVEPPHVAGFSFGGWLSIELARRGFARSVVAFSPAGGWRNAQDYRAIARKFRVLYATVDWLRFLVAPLLCFGWIRKRLASQGMEHGERVPAAQFRALLNAVSKSVVLPGLLRTMGRDGPIAPLEAVGTLIRIAWCERDRTIPWQHYGEPLVERLHGAEFGVLTGVGHVPIYDDPDAVVDCILTVTSRVDATESAVCPIGGD